MGLQNATRLGMLCLLLSGCATIPDVTTAYYFPKAHTEFVVTQTIGCSPLVANKHRLLRSVITVAATTTDAADLDWKENGSVRQGRFRFKALNGTLSDGDGTVTLTADGRLSAINATTAGQGGAIIKDVVTVAGVNKHPTGTPYRRARGTPFAVGGRLSR